MLYETLNQLPIFLCLFAGGFCSGLFFDFRDIFCTFLKKNKFFYHFFTFLATFFTLFVAFFINLRVNYGQPRAFCIFAFLISFCLERFISKNFLANIFVRCYNKIKVKRNGQKKEKHI